MTRCTLCDWPIFGTPMYLDEKVPLCWSCYRDESSKILPRPKPVEYPKCITCGDPGLLYMDEDINHDRPFCYECSVWERMRLDQLESLHGDIQCKLE